MAGEGIEPLTFRQRWGTDQIFVLRSVPLQKMFCSAPNRGSVTIAPLRSAPNHVPIRSALIRKPLRKILLPQDHFTRFEE
jgi:hypothetical protein